MKFFLLLLPLFLFSIIASGQVSLKKDSLIQRIFEAQSKGDSFYHAGLFPTERFRANRKKIKQDNTIFFTALIAYTLQSNSSSLPANQRTLIDAILSRAGQNYFRYKSRRGEVTYNFWQTNPEMPFPNDPLKSKKERYRMPDDFDDTSMIFLTSQSSDSLNRILKDRMILHTNLFEKKVHGTYARYRKFKAYNTWFGKKMPLDFDVCVMTNTLLFVLRSGLELNEYDRMTIDLIKKTIFHNDHLRHPVMVAPYYQRSSIILYHVARLLAEPGASSMQDIRAKVIADLQDLLKTSVSPIDKLLITTSLYRLGMAADKPIDVPALKKDMERYVFFAATPFAGKPLWIRRLVGSSGFLNYNHSCEAYYWALVLENEILRESAGSKR